MITRARTQSRKEIKAIWLITMALKLKTINKISSAELVREPGGVGANKIMPKRFQARELDQSLCSRQIRLSGKQHF